MKDSHLKLYELLVKFDELCRQHGIEYYLSAGTTIGAMRHQGFIPWDDDADLLISRNNYKKLLACKDSFFDESFILVNNSEFPTYGNTVVRLVSTSGTSITKTRIIDGTPKGEYLELFILDPLPDEPELRKDWLVKHWIYTELMVFAFRIARPQVEPWVDEELYRQYFARYESEGRDVILRELENELFNIEETEVHDWCTRWGSGIRIYPIEWFGMPRRVPFGDTELPVQAAVERCLRYEYGDDWANIPYAEDRKTHPIIRNQKVNYRIFVGEYLQYIDAKELFKTYPKRDKASLDMYFARRKTRAKRLRIKEAHIKGVVSRLSLASIAKEACTEDIEHAFHLWRNYQLSSDFWQWHRCIDLEDDVLRLFLNRLFEIDGFSPVKKVLEWRKRDHALSEQLSEIDYYVHDISEVYTLVDEKRFSEARVLHNRLLQERYSRYSTMYDMRYLDVLLDVNAMDGISNLEDLLHRAQALANDFSESGDALFLLAKVEDRLGLTAQSRGHLIQAKTMTRNAFFLREIDGILSNSDHEEGLKKAVNDKTTEDAQAILVKLLSEIHEVCLEEKLSYFLANINALSAYRTGEFGGNATRLEIMMLFEDALELVKKLTDRPGRALESIYTNKNYPDISFRYCDTETTRLTLDSRNLQYENSCLCVYIEILKESYKGFLGRLTKKLENVWAQYRKSSGKEKNSVLQGCCRALLKLLFRHSQRKASFNNKLYVDFLNGERKDFRKNVFSSQTLVSLEGQPCYIAGDSEGYFSSIYGKQWKEKAIEAKQEKQTTIVDTNLSYKQFVLDIKAANETLDFTNEYANQVSTKKRFDAIDTKFAQAWDIAWRTEEKFKMEEFYAPHKQEILALHKEKKWPELIELFKDYDEVAIYFNKKHLSVCFDDELFDIYLDVLRQQGRMKLATSLEKLSREEKSTLC